MRGYSIQVDPFFKFTTLTTRNSLFRFNPATLLSIDRGELKYEGGEEEPNWGYSQDRDPLTRGKTLYRSVSTNDEFVLDVV